MKNMPVSPKKWTDLEQKMARLGLLKSDLEEHFIRSSGAGGQKVNKTAACVLLKDRKSGIEVKCQKERSQALNRFWARRWLVEKLEQKLYGQKSEAEQRRWKIRKQKKRRSKKAKEKILREKKHQSKKKEFRKSILA